MDRGVLVLGVIALLAVCGLQAVQAQVSSNFMWTGPNGVAPSTTVVAGGPFATYWLLGCNATFPGPTNCFANNAECSSFRINTRSSITRQVVSTIWDVAQYCPNPSVGSVPQQGPVIQRIPGNFTGNVTVQAYAKDQLFSPLLTVTVQSPVQWVAPASNTVLVAGTSIQVMWNLLCNQGYDCFALTKCSSFTVELRSLGGARITTLYTNNNYCPRTASANPPPAVLPVAYSGAASIVAVSNGEDWGVPLPVTIVSPTCNMSSVLASLPANTVRGSCADSLVLGASCDLACVSPYQVPTGPSYSCSAAAQLSGAQVCADPVCAQTGPGAEVIVQVLGGKYNGPLSAALGGVISVSASMPYPGLAGNGEVGSLVFEGVADASYACSSNSAVVGTTSTGSCFLAVPTSGSTFALTTSFVYQKDWCTRFVGTVSTNITLVDLARVQAVADGARADGIAETARAIAKENSLQAATSALAASLANETARAMGAEAVLRSDLSQTAARVSVLEAADASFLFRGLQSGISVSYPLLSLPGSGAANQLNKRIVFDQALSDRGTAIRYNASTGVVSIVQPGAYRLDAFVHLYSANSVGTGIVSWMTLGASPQPIGPNILNPNTMGVPQGTVGDSTFVSTLVNVPDSVSAAAPFTAQCVLISMNQRKNEITDASVISVTKLK